MRVETPTSPLLPHHVPPEGRYCLYTPEHSRLPEPSVCTGQPQLRPSVPNLSLLYLSVSPFISFIACYFPQSGLSVLAVQRPRNDVWLVLSLSLSLFTLESNREKVAEKVRGRETNTFTWMQGLIYFRRSDATEQLKDATRCFCRYCSAESYRPTYSVKMTDL